MHRTDYQLDQTCDACPEQYDVYLDGREVGYLRLRHGYFRAEYTADGGDEIVYEASPEGDGIFEPEERNYYLNRAIQAIDTRHHGGTSTQETVVKNEAVSGWSIR